jgi:hypothetical protein
MKEQPEKNKKRSKRERRRKRMCGRILMEKSKKKH